MCRSVVLEASSEKGIAHEAKRYVALVRSSGAARALRVRAVLQRTRALTQHVAACQLVAE
jgi:hypothetical protein